VLPGAPRCSQVYLKGTISVQLSGTCRLGDWKSVIPHERVRGSDRAVRTVRITRVFLMKTRVVADVSTQSAQAWLHGRSWEQWAFKLIYS
jgi:hypothetical protein